MATRVTLPASKAASEADLLLEQPALLPSEKERSEPVGTTTPFSLQRKAESIQCSASLCRLSLRGFKKRALALTTEASRVHCSETHRGGRASCSDPRIGARPSSLLRAGAFQRLIYFYSAKLLLTLQRPFLLPQPLYVSLNLCAFNGCRNSSHYQLRSNHRSAFCPTKLSASRSRTQQRADIFSGGSCVSENHFDSRP